MAVTEATPPSTRRGTALTASASVLLGVPIGLLIVYVISLAANLPSAGDFTIHPLSLAALALVGVATVLIGWRLPLAGMTAGLVILLVVAFAVTSRIAWSSSGGAWLDPFNAVGFAAASGYPTLIGAMVLTISALRFAQRPRQ